MLSHYITFKRIPRSFLQWPFARPRDLLCADFVLFVEFVSGREKTSNVLGHFHILLQINTHAHAHTGEKHILKDINKHSTCWKHIYWKSSPPYADVTFHLLGRVCVWIPRAPADTTLTMWKLMVSSLLVISTVMADLLCAMVPMSFHLLHAWKYIQKKEWWKKEKHI